jgi:hypothetical protein
MRQNWIYNAQLNFIKRLFYLELLNKMREIDVFHQTVDQSGRWFNVVNVRGVQFEERRITEEHFANVTF